MNLDLEVTVCFTKEEPEHENRKMMEKSYITLFQHDRMINIRLCILTGTGSFQEAPTIDGLKITTGNSSLFWYSRYSAMALV